MPHRRTDSPRKGRMWIWLRRIYFAWQNFVPLFAVFALYLVLSDVNARRDQTCALFERQEEAAVTRLRAQYDFLDALPKDEYGSTLAKAIVNGLPAVEQEARATKAPPYCNEPGVGLDEKRVPKIPAHRNYLDRTIPPPD